MSTVSWLLLSSACFLFASILHILDGEYTRATNAGALALIMFIFMLIELFSNYL